MVLSKVVSTSMPAVYFVSMRISSNSVFRSKWNVQKHRRNSEYCFSCSITLNQFFLHPSFTWSSWIPMRWKSSSFSSSFLAGRWRLTTEIPMFASLYHLFCGFKNVQKQPCVCVLQKRCSLKCCKIYRKTRASESIFNKVKLATLLKKDFGVGVFQ